MAEWLRQWTANPLSSARVGSNPILVDGSILAPLFYVVLLGWGKPFYCSVKFVIFYSFGLHYEE